MQNIQSKGPIYTLHLLSLVEIRFFNEFFWESKMGFGIVMKKLCGMQDSYEKGVGMWDQHPPFHTLFEPTRDHMN